MSEPAGGLGRLRRSRNLNWWRVVAVLATLGYLAAFALERHSLMWWLGFALAFAVVVFAEWLWSLYGSRDVRIDQARQPELYGLVGDTVIALGVPAPGRVYLGANAEVVGRVRRGRRELIIGLPMASALPRAELAALVAHELAVLATPGGERQIKFYRRWAEASDLTAWDDEGESESGRLATALRDLGPLGEAVERAVDAMLPDHLAAATAMIRANRIYTDFGVFTTITRSQLRTRVAGFRYRIEDLHDGWRRQLFAAGGVLGAVDVDDDDVQTVVGRRHPYLTSAARALIGTRMSIAVSADTVSVAALSRREQRLLATRTLRDPRKDMWARWCTFQTAPAEIWRRDAANNARRLVDSIATVIGHRPEDAVAAAEVVRNRPVEVSMAEMGDDDWEASDIDPDGARAADWGTLLEDTLLRAGWVYVDPAVPGTLRGHDGTVLNGTELCRRAVEDPFAYAELRRLLSAR